MRDQLTSKLPGRLLSVPYILLVLFVAIIPIALMVSYAFRESSFAMVGPGPTLEQFQEILQSSTAVTLMLRTLGVATVVALIGTTVSFVFAYGIVFRLSRRTGMTMLAVVLAAGIASYLARVFAWGTILGTNGLINSTLSSLGVIDKPLGFLYFGYIGIVIVMVYLYLPLAILMMYSSMRSIDPDTIKVSNDLGVGRWRTAIKVVAPQAKTGIITAFSLLILLSTADYITPRLVGGTHGQMVGTLIRDQALTSGDYPGAAALAISFTVLIALFALAAMVLLKAGRWISSRLVTGSVNRAAAWFTAHAPSLGSRRSISRFAVYLVAIYLVAPAFVVVAFSFNESGSLSPPITGLTLHWYGDIVRTPGFTDAASTSVKLAALAVVAAGLIGVPYALLLTRGPKRGRPVLWSLAVIPWSIPGVLLGLAIVIAFSATGMLLGFGITALAHILLTAPIVITVVAAQLSNLDPQLSNAARDLGSGPARAFRTVTFPLILPSIVGSMLIAAAYSLDEIFVTSFTIGTGSTLPVWLLGQSRKGFDPSIDALAVLLAVSTVALFAIALLVQRRASSQ